MPERSRFRIIGILLVKVYLLPKLCSGRNCLKLCFLDWSDEIIVGNIILFEAELPA
jgi:hypothetical protein